MAASTQGLLLWSAAAAASTTSAASRPFGVTVTASLSDLTAQANSPSPLQLVPVHALHLRGGSQEDASSDKSTKEETKTKKSKKKKTRSKTSEQAAADSSSSSTPETAFTDSTSSKTKQQSPSSSSLPSAVQEILKQDDYYEILGLTRSPSLTDRAITKAYRRRCVVTHPDKTGGDRRAFDKVAQAYSVLSDPQQRAVYDRYGKAGLEQGGASGASGFASAEDLFQSFFGGGPSFFGAPPPPQRPRQNRTVRYQLEVTLEGLYQGFSQSVQIGAGGGSPKRKTVSVDVPRGAQDGQRIRLSGEIDFDTTQAPGDLIFLLKQRPHPVFTRKGHDLAVVLTISLQEAVGGVKRQLQHLSGETLLVGSARTLSGDPVVIQTGDVQVLKGKGMPKNKLASSFGDLYIQYQVELPTMKHTLTKEERTELTRLLNKLEGKKADDTQMDESKIQYFEPAKASDFGRASGSPPPLTPDDDDLHADETGGNPFSRRGFFYSSSTGREFPFGFPFEQASDDVQCRQM